MPTFKNLIDIKTNPWSYEFSVPNSTGNILPSSIPWNNDREIKIDDVVIWEQLYYEPGNVGVYAAFNPYEEFYIITHNLFLKNTVGVEIFSGTNSIQQCYDRATELGINLRSY